MTGSRLPQIFISVASNTGTRLVYCRITLFRSLERSGTATSFVTHPVAVFPCGASVGHKDGGDFKWISCGRLVDLSSYTADC